tara:strand:+ start:2286 stop:2954 length:669 start_codon:yes stop_codon:yes gene_type:complete
MKKFSVILSSVLLITTLTTFNPINFSSNFQLFEIDKIEIRNLKILEEKRIKNLFYNELYGSSLLILDKKKINSILNDNKLIEYIELKKIYPSKLQIIIHEKETIAIINFKQTKYYLTKSGEEIEFFQNFILEKLPNIFGKQKNFLEVYSALSKLKFPISEIRSFYYFDIGRWDIILNNNKVIKLPVINFVDSLKNYMELNKKINFKKYSIFDYRIKDQLILN